MRRADAIELLKEYGYELSKTAEASACKYGLPIKHSIEGGIDEKFKAPVQYKSIAFAFDNNVVVHSPHGRIEVNDLVRLREVLELIK